MLVVGKDLAELVLIVKGGGGTPMPTHQMWHSGPRGGRVVAEHVGSEGQVERTYASPDEMPGAGGAGEAEPEARAFVAAAGAVYKIPPDVAAEASGTAVEAPAASEPAGTAPTTDTPPAGAADTPPDAEPEPAGTEPDVKPLRPKYTSTDAKQYLHQSGDRLDAANEGERQARQDESAAADAFAQARSAMDHADARDRPAAVKAFMAADVAYQQAYAARVRFQQEARSAKMQVEFAQRQLHEMALADGLKTIPAKRPDVKAALTKHLEDTRADLHKLEGAKASADEAWKAARASGDAPAMWAATTRQQDVDKSLREAQARIDLVTQKMAEVGWKAPKEPRASKTAAAPAADAGEPEPLIPIDKTPRGSDLDARVRAFHAEPAPAPKPTPRTAPDAGTLDEAVARIHDQLKAKRKPWRGPPKQTPESVAKWNAKTKEVEDMFRKKAPLTDWIEQWRHDERRA